MTPREIPKPIKRKLRELVGRAYEAALRKALSKLRDDFEAWRRGDIDSFELEARIHRFHDGEAREIYNEFNYTTATLPAHAARAIATGLVDASTVPEDVLQYLQNALAFYRRMS